MFARISNSEVFATRVVPSTNELHILQSYI